MAGEMKIAAIGLALAFLAAPVIAQSRLDDVVERLLDERDDLDADRLYDLAERPVDLTRAPMDELQAIPLLPQIAVDSIMVIRMSDDATDSIEAWIQRLGLDGIEAEVLRTFAVARPHEQVPGEVLRLRPDVRLTSRFSRRIDVGRGYRRDEDGHATYAGTPERLYQRMHVRLGNLQANLTMDKAPGEPFSWHPERRGFGFTHSSGYVTYAPSSLFVERVIAGDYRADFGYGLVSGSSLFSSKGRETTRSVRHGGRGLQPSSSSMRLSYLRGASAALRLNRLSVFMFASRVAIDATVDTVVIDEVTSISAARSNTGYYRTETERARMRSLPETTLGAAVEWQQGAVSIGAATLRTSWPATMTMADRADLIPLENRSAFIAQSIYTHLRLPALSAGGEIALAGSSAPALIAAVTLHPDDKTEVLGVYRRYPPDFDNHHATSFGHQSTPRNETGIYFGIRAALLHGLTFRAFIDHYRFPWLRFGMRTPSSGMDRLAEIEYRPRRWWTIQVLGRSRVEEHRIPTAATDNISGVGIANRTSVRLHQDFRIDDRWRVRVRAEASRYSNDSSRSDVGLMLYHDLSWQPRRSVTVAGRVTFFDVSHFDARIFAHETSPGTFALQQLNGIGDRWYWMVSWQIMTSTRLQVKYSRHRLEDARTMGSGHDEVEGNRLREIAAQLVVRL